MPRQPAPSFEAAGIALRVDHPHAGWDDHEVVDVGATARQPPVMQDQADVSDGSVEEASHLFLTQGTAVPSLSGRVGAGNEFGDRRQGTVGRPTPGIVSLSTSFAFCSG